MHCFHYINFSCWKVRLNSAAGTRISMKYSTNKGYLAFLYLLYIPLNFALSALINDSSSIRCIKLFMYPTIRLFQKFSTHSELCQVCVFFFTSSPLPLVVTSKVESHPHPIWSPQVLYYKRSQGGPGANKNWNNSQSQLLNLNVKRHIPGLIPHHIFQQ